MKIITNPHPKVYLTSLSRRVEEDIVLFPEIDEKTLTALEESDTPVVIANDWFSHGAYEYGAFVLSGDSYISLQDLAGTKIVNTDGEFIFESGTDDHKGLIAIEIKKGTPFFIMESSSAPLRDEVVFYFEPEAMDEYVNTVLGLMTHDGQNITVVRDQWLTIYADDYRKIVRDLPVKLI